MAKRGKKGRRPSDLDLIAVLADPQLRKLVLELMREDMGPSRFHRRFGGASFGYVNRLFQRAAKLGVIAKVGKRHDGRRRGPPENLYRTVHPPMWDDRAWARLPRPMKVLVTALGVTTLFERLFDVLEAGEIGSRDERHVSVSRASLAEPDCKKRLRRLKRALRFAVAEQRRAAERLKQSGEEPTVLFVALLGFEAGKRNPAPAGNPRERAGKPRGEGADLPLYVRMEKALKDPLNRKIYEELTRGLRSPSGYYRRFGGGSVSRVDRRFKTLMEYGWAELVEERKGGRRRGGTEHFYRAIEPPLYDEEIWAALVDRMERQHAPGKISRLLKAVRSAMVTETLESRDDSHVSWMELSLDAIGRKKVLEKLDRLHETFEAEKAAEKERGERSGGKPVPLVVGLLALGMPPPADGGPGAADTAP